MNKRLRKKYRVGEFRELCFSFTFNYKGDVESEECGAFLKALVEDCIEAKGLNCDGQLSDNGCHLTVVALDPKTTSQAQLEEVKQWLEARSDVEVENFSGIEDLWYGAI